MNSFKRLFCTNRCRISGVHNLKHCLSLHVGVIRLNSNSLHRLLVSMPKSEQSNETLRHVKYRKKREESGQKMPVPSRIDVQVIGTGARGTPKSVTITTDYSRYLFNCGEGTQRISHEHKMKLAKLENVFITYKSWENMGGLLGMALTLESVRVPQITLHGPDGIERVVQMAKSFNSQHSTIKLDKKKLSDGRFEDSALAIDYVVLRRDGQTSSHSEQAPTHRGGNPSSSTEDDPSPMKRARLDLEVDSHDYSVAYICLPNPPLRKLLIERCVELGVPSGPVCGQLKEGKSITLENGKVITPEDVLSSPEISRPIIVLECPSVEFIKALTESREFRQYQADGDKDSPCLIVHMTPVSVMEVPDYQTWMNSFGAETHHLVVNESTSTIMFEGVYRIQAMLNLLDDRIFPLLPHQLEKENLLATAEQVTLAKTNLFYRYRPSKGFDSEQCIKIDTKTFVDTAKQQENVTEELDKLSQIRNQRNELEDNLGATGDFPEVVFLGTGSSVPSKVRNVTCILLQTQKNRYMILDCGEGTLGQMYHHYGNRVDDVLENLDAIFVSHMHADHHMGMFGVLEARRQVLEARGKPHTPLLVLAPVQMTRWLKFYSQQIPQSHDYIRLVSLQSIMPHQLEATLEMYTGVLEELNLRELRPVMVDHCKNAFGVCITHKEGWKLVYSGDTMPCKRLVEAGEGCDLLIHEATMEDELEEEAKSKTHSQRYSKVPVFNEQFSDKVGIAFDNMRVRLKDMKLLPLFLPALKALFAEESALLEERSFKRKLNKTKGTKTGRIEILELFGKKAEGKS